MYWSTCGFYDWFVECQIDAIKTSMLYNTRRSGGLGNPPSPYYTNAVESINSLLKLRTDCKKQELTVFVTKLKELVESQVDRAVAGMGDYQVHTDYKRFSYSTAYWFSMTEDQRQIALKKFQSAILIHFLQDDDTTSTVFSSQSAITKSTVKSKSHQHYFLVSLLNLAINSELQVCNNTMKTSCNPKVHSYYHMAKSSNPSSTGN